MFCKIVWHLQKGLYSSPLTYRGHLAFPATFLYFSAKSPSFPQPPPELLLVCQHLLGSDIFWTQLISFTRFCYRHPWTVSTSIRTCRRKYREFCWGKQRWLFRGSLHWQMHMQQQVCWTSECDRLCLNAKQYFWCSFRRMGRTPWQQTWKSFWLNSSWGSWHLRVSSPYGRYKFVSPNFREQSCMRI